MQISTLPPDTPRRLLSVLVRPETAEHFDFYRERGKALREGFKMLFGKTVVGTSTATCLPSITALKAARTATSVLP
jgi:hypothetical protein